MHMAEEDFSVLLPENMLRVRVLVCTALTLTLTQICCVGYKLN